VSRLGRVSLSDPRRNPLSANRADTPVDRGVRRARVATVTQIPPSTHTAGGGAGIAVLDDHIYQRLLRERIVFLGSEVRDQNANAICAQLLLLSAEDPETDIFLHINSPGGSVDAGMAIYDTMNYIPNDVATVGMGLAASMGQFLLCAGTKGKRYALPHSRIMMHQPSSGMGGSASDIKIQAQQSLHIKKVLLELIAEHTGQTVEQIEADADRDRWFTAEQAKEYGLVDQVITNSRDAADDGRPARQKS
jgi:ATP-dependent Clp protease protease subunit